MDADGLVRAIRAALDETERIARDAESVMVWVHWPRQNGKRAFGRFVTHNDPAAVLRRVAADREIVDEHYIIERKVNWLDDEGEDRQTHLPVCVVCVPKYSSFDSREQATGPCKTVRALARGLGITPETETP